MKKSLCLAVGLTFGMGATGAMALPVIPGAKGFGIETPAGRGGAVYRVTNLNESGSGSLKECIDKSGPRVCVFEVSGTIRLSRNLNINNPYITIAGQTAPSPGITLRGASLVVANTHDVLIQHIRVRVGDDSSGPSADNRDGLQILADKAAAKNIVIDHVSVSWAVDENFQFWYAGVSDVTVRNSISSEALFDSIHSKGPHSMGLIVGPDIKRVSVIGSLFAHNNERNPRLKSGSLTEFANNVVYNWGNRAVDTENDANIEGNVFKKGPSTKSSCVYERSAADIYMKDNMECSFSDVSSPKAPRSGYTAMPSAAVMDYVLANAGARPADRDSADERVVNDVKYGTGRIINRTSDVGGWPSLAVNHRTLALPGNPNGDDNNDGYTNLEEWLHGFSAQVEGVGSAAPEVPKGLRIQVR